jgi:hypothetical protein
MASLDYFTIAVMSCACGSWVQLANPCNSITINHHSEIEGGAPSPGVPWSNHLDLQGPSDAVCQADDACR